MAESFLRWDIPHWVSERADGDGGSVGGAGM